MMIGIVLHVIVLYSGNEQVIGYMGMAYVMVLIGVLAHHNYYDDGWGKREHTLLG